MRQKHGAVSADERASVAGAKQFRMQAGKESPYISVKQAIRELQQATLLAKQNQRPTAQLPPVWNLVHAKEDQARWIRLQHTNHLQPSKRAGFAPAEESLTAFTQSASSSVPPRRPRTTALGSGSALNSPSTYTYGAQPLKAELTRNQYCAVGSLSMLGSQV